MEYCYRGSLSSLICRDNPLNEDAIREIAACTLLGLQYLHSNNIVHRVSVFRLCEPVGHKTAKFACFGNGPD